MHHIPSTSCIASLSTELFQQVSSKLIIPSPYLVDITSIVNLVLNIRLAEYEIITLSTVTALAP